MGSSHKSHKRHRKHRHREPDFLDALAYSFVANKDERRRIDEVRRRQRDKERGREKSHSSSYYKKRHSYHSEPSRRPGQSHHSKHRHGHYHHRHHRRRHSFDDQTSEPDVKENGKGGHPESIYSTETYDLTEPLPRYQAYASPDALSRRRSTYQPKKESIRKRFTRDLKEIDRLRKEKLDEWRDEKEQKMMRAEEHRAKRKEAAKHKKDNFGWFDRLKHGKLWPAKSKHHQHEPKADASVRSSSNASSHQPRPYLGSFPQEYRPPTPPRPAAAEETQWSPTPRQSARQSSRPPPPAPVQDVPQAPFRAPSASTEWPGPFDDANRRRAARRASRDRSSHRGSDYRGPSRRGSDHEEPFNRGPTRHETAERGSFRREPSRQDSVRQHPFSSGSIPQNPSRSSSGVTAWPGPFSRESVREGSAHGESRRGSARHEPMPPELARQGSYAAGHQTRRPNNVTHERERPPNSFNTAMNAHRQCAQDFGIASNPYRDPALATRSTSTAYQRPTYETEDEESDGIDMATVFPDDSVSCAAWKSPGSQARGR
jgi:hypothetical protein